MHSGLQRAGPRATSAAWRRTGDTRARHCLRPPVLVTVLIAEISAPIRPARVSSARAAACTRAPAQVSWSTHRPRPTLPASRSRPRTRPPHHVHGPQHAAPPAWSRCGLRLRRDGCASPTSIIFASRLSRLSPATVHLAPAASPPSAPVLSPDFFSASLVSIGLFEAQLTRVPVFPAAQKSPR